MSTGLTEGIGILGVVLILFGFYRISIGRWTGRSLWYELDNLAGAICLIIYSFQKTAYVNIVLNVVWAIVAFNGIISIAERRPKRRPKRK